MRGLLTNIQKVPSLGAGAVASRGRTQADARLADEHPEGLRILVLPIVLRDPPILGIHHGGSTKSTRAFKRCRNEAAE